MANDTVMFFQVLLRSIELSGSFACVILSFISMLGHFGSKN